MAGMYVVHAIYFLAVLPVLRRSAVLPPPMARVRTKMRRRPMAKRRFCYGERFRRDIARGVHTGMATLPASHCREKSSRAPATADAGCVTYAFAI